MKNLSLYLATLFAIFANFHSAFAEEVQVAECYLSNIRNNITVTQELTSSESEIIKKINDTEFGVTIAKDNSFSSAYIRNSAKNQQSVIGFLKSNLGFVLILNEYESLTCGISWRDRQ